MAACQRNAPGAGDVNEALDGGFAATSLNTLVQMVDAGLGVSLMPPMAVESRRVERYSVAIRHLRCDHAYR